MRDTNNFIIGGLGTVQDITELKDNEAKLLESREQVRRLAAYCEDIREDERARIAREIHDEMGQQLTVLRLDVSLLEKRFGHLSPEITDMLVSVKKGIDASINAIQTITSSLRPLALDAGLVGAVDWLLESFQLRTRIQGRLIVDGVEMQLGNGVSTTAFRVIQESLTNVIRHAQASRVTVRIVFHERELLLSVADNGVGFDSANVSPFRRSGLMGIRERVLVYGGTTMIDSELERGTTLSVTIPVNESDLMGESHQ